jgi:hypothetical protein
MLAFILLGAVLAVPVAILCLLSVSIGTFHAIDD